MWNFWTERGRSSVGNFVRSSISRGEASEEGGEGGGEDDDEGGGAGGTQSISPLITARPFSPPAVQTFVRSNSSPDFSPATCLRRYIFSVDPCSPNWRMSPLYSSDHFLGGSRLDDFMFRYTPWEEAQS